jgi:hypothetical protein
LPAPSLWVAVTNEPSHCMFHSAVFWIAVD